MTKTRMIAGTQFDTLVDRAGRRYGYKAIFGGWQILIVESGDSPWRCWVGDPLTVATGSDDMEKNGWSGVGRGYTAKLGHFAKLDDAASSAISFVQECINALSTPTPLRSPR
jgi:hypothetical protein